MHYAQHAPPHVFVRNRQAEPSCSASLHTATFGRCGPVHSALSMSNRHGSANSESLLFYKQQSQFGGHMAMVCWSSAGVISHQLRTNKSQHSAGEPACCDPLHEDVHVARGYQRHAGVHSNRASHTTAFSSSAAATATAACAVASTAVTLALGRRRPGCHLGPPRAAGSYCVQERGFVC